MRNCPICQSKNYAIIKSISYRIFNEHPYNKGYDLVECDNCNFIYANLLISQSELDSYYINQSKYEDKEISTGTGYNVHDKKRLEDTASFLSEKIQDKSIRIIDIGCANGGLLSELKELGFQNVYGLDPSLSCVNFTKKNVGCECYHSSIFNIENITIGKFDLVIYTHVLEHVIDVQKLIQISKSILNPNGYLYIECPDSDSYYKFIHSPLQEFNSEHINHFTKTSFENLTSSNGFKTLAIDTKDFRLESNNPYYAVFGLFQVTDQKEFTIKKDETNLDNINKYIELSELELSEIISKIDTLDPNVPIALFGIGQFCSKILGFEIMRKFPKVRLFDNSVMNIGKSIDSNVILSGKTIVDEYKKEKFNIIITSLISEEPIRKMLVELFKEENPLIIGFSKKQ